MLNSAQDAPILLADFSKRIGKTYNTVWRWWRKGVLNRETRRVVRLETRRETTGRCTTQVAYNRFLDELNETGTLRTSRKRGAR